MSSIKVTLTEGSREIELEGEFAEVQQLLAMWLSQPAPATGTSGTSAPVVANGAGATSAGQADHMAVNTAWSGTINVDRPTTVDPGVTLTIAAGSVVTLSDSGSLIIGGIVDIQGTKTAKVTIAAPAPDQGHGGISILGGGELRMNYAQFSGGGLAIGLNGKATIADSTLSNPRSAADFIVLSGGTLAMQFSEISLADAGHTALLLNGASNVISVTHCTISGAPYGLMFYGGKNAVFTSNNWDNTVNVDTTSGVSGDFSQCYFRGGGPRATAGSTLVANNVSTAPIVDAKPRS